MPETTTQFTRRTKQPYRYDFVGSFLRPQYLKDARQQYRDGEISRDKLTEVEDNAIIDLIKKEEDAGLKEVTDGEFRRSWWHYDFMWGLQGVDKMTFEGGGKFHGVKTRSEGAAVTSSHISGKNHPFLKHYQFVVDHKSDNVEAKLTIPAAAQVVQEVCKQYNVENTRKYFSSRYELADEVAKAYGEFFQEYYDQGGYVLQMDDCTWGRMVTIPEEGADEYDQPLGSREELSDLYLYTNNKAISYAPDGLTINTHVCRGNYKSTWFGNGGYGSVADTLLAQEHVNAFFLEYDSERAGSFEPLAKVPDDTVVVLGLITTKDGKLEDRDQVIDRIYEASQYHDLNQLCLSPQCGFSSTEEGNVITEDQQWQKIALVKSIAEEVWGAED